VTSDFDYCNFWQISQTLAFLYAHEMTLSRSMVLSVNALLACRIFLKLLMTSSEVGNFEF
jgi:hypothetical protein